LFISAGGFEQEQINWEEVKEVTGKFWKSRMRIRPKYSATVAFS